MQVIPEAGVSSEELGISLGRLDPVSTDLARISAALDRISSLANAGSKHRDVSTD